MDACIEPFVPPHPAPPTRPPSIFEVIRTALRNPLELWGMPAYTQPHLSARFLNERMIIANDPDLIRYVLVDNASNYRMATVRQLILRPILRDGLLTAEGSVWKRSRKAMAPVFTPRNIHGFAEGMVKTCEDFCQRYARDGSEHEIGHDMTDLTYQILATTLFSGEVAGKQDGFADDVELLLNTMGRIDPLDLLKAPGWIPRIMRIRGRGVMKKFRRLVSETAALRRERMRVQPDGVPEDFLTLLLRAEGPQGLSEDEIEDNIITFIGAGHETTARALAWTLYCLAHAPHERAQIEAEIDGLAARGDVAPADWINALPKTRAAFEEAMRLYPPAPSINRAAIEDDRFGDLIIPRGVTVLVMPWTLHRHHMLWDNPDAFVPSRFWPENRERIHRFQYLPFGAGPRICIGASFALQEAVIALAILLGRFQFDMAQGAVPPWPVQKLTTQPDGGIRMVVRHRSTG